MADIEEQHYDLGVIGCGPGGFATAMRALDLGKHVCIVEGSEIGGAGVMWGALASKTMWELAKDFSIGPNNLNDIIPDVFEQPWLFYLAI